jgi:hypothetical protein
MSDALPGGAYLASRFRDPHRQREVRRVFHEDGRVTAFDGSEWWTVCTFTPDQVARAKEAVRSSGLTDAQDLADEDAHDVAAVTYAWRLDGESGAVTNWAYPARQHPVFEALDERLDALEAEAGAEWSTL